MIERRRNQEEDETIMECDSSNIFSGKQFAPRISDSDMLDFIEMAIV